MSFKIVQHNTQICRAQILGLVPTHTLYNKPFSTVYCKKCAKLYPGKKKNANIFYLCKILGRSAFFRRAIL